MPVPDLLAIDSLGYAYGDRQAVRAAACMAAVARRGMSKDALRSNQRRSWNGA